MVSGRLRTGNDNPVVVSQPGELGNARCQMAGELVALHSSEPPTALFQGGRFSPRPVCRRGYHIGVDDNDTALARCKEKTDFDYAEATGKVYLHKGDARHLSFIPDSSIDFICTHPPYANIIAYSTTLEGDLSRLKPNAFLGEMRSVAKECFRVLKAGKFCAILMGDTRQKGCMVPLSFEVMRIFQDAGFTLKETIIKAQHNCKATGYWKTNSLKYNFFLIAHEYLFVFRK